MGKDNLLLGLLGFFVGASLPRRRSVTVRRIGRRKNPKVQTVCQFCGMAIKPLGPVKKRLLTAYRIHLQHCSAIIPVEATQCDCCIESPLKNVDESDQNSDQKQST